jgi:putative flippase GtrA
MRQVLSTSGTKVTRYAAVAAVCAITHNIVLIASELLAAPTYAGVGASFIIVVAIGFWLHGRFTFRSRYTLRSFARYAAAMSVNAPVLLALLYLLHDFGGMPMAMAAPAATVFTAALNFLLARSAFSATTLHKGKT